MVFAIVLYSCSIDQEMVLPEREIGAMPDLDEKEIIFLEGYGKTQLPVESASFDEFGLLGNGYDVSGEYAVHDEGYSSKSSVIDINALKNSSNSYHRSLLSKGNILSQGDKSFSCDNALEFSNILKLDLGLSDEIRPFRQSISSKFPNAVTTSNKFKGQFIYHSYSISYKYRKSLILGDFTAPDSPGTVMMRDNYLNESFVNYVAANSPSQIIQTFGTHVMVAVQDGHRFEILFQGQTKEPDRHRQAYALTLGKGGENQNNTHKFAKWETKGGGRNAQIKGELDLEKGGMNQNIDLDAWIATHTDQNQRLIAHPNNSLIPIHFFIEDPVKREQVRSYVEAYLASRSVILSQETVEVFRYYSSAGMDHLYLTAESAGEEDLTGYGNKQVAWRAFDYRAPGTFPVYRYYNSTGVNHHYQMGNGIQVPTSPAGYVYEKLAFYAFSSSEGGTSPVYQAYRHESNRKFDHFYTKSQNEYNIALSSNYAGEGIKFHVY